MSPKEKINYLYNKFPEPPDEHPFLSPEGVWDNYRKTLHEFHQLLNDWGAPFPEGDISEENSVVWRFRQLIRKLENGK